LIDFELRRKVSQFSLNGVFGLGRVGLFSIGDGGFGGEGGWGKFQISLQGAH